MEDINKVMYRCEKCGKDTMDYDYTFMDINDKRIKKYGMN